MTETLQWFATPDGRLAAAGILFALIWVIKNLPMVKDKLLTTDRRRLIATIIVGLSPAAIMLADTTVPAGEAWRFAFWTLLGAMGIQGGTKALLGELLAGRLKIGNGTAAPSTKPSKTSGDGGTSA